MATMSQSTLHLTRSLILRFLKKSKFVKSSACTLVLIIILGCSCKNADSDETVQSESSLAVRFCKNKSLATIEVLKYCIEVH